MRKQFVVSSGWTVFYDAHISLDTDDFDSEEVMEEYALNEGVHEASAAIEAIEHVIEYDGTGYREVMEK